MSDAEEEIAVNPPIRASKPSWVATSSASPRHRLQGTLVDRIERRKAAQNVRTTTNRTGYTIV